jgi:hypothetical protein
MCLGLDDVHCTFGSLCLGVFFFLVFYIEECLLFFSVLFVFKFFLI